MHEELFATEEDLMRHTASLLRHVVPTHAEYMDMLLRFACTFADLSTIAHIQESIRCFKARQGDK